MQEITSSQKPSRALLILAFACVYFIWGSTYLAIRFMIETLPIFISSGIRFITAGIILYIIALFSTKERPKAIHWRSTFLIGFMLLLIGNGAVVWAEKEVPSGIAALIASTTPIWFVLFGWLIFKTERPSLRVIMGIAIGLIGIVLLIGPSNLISGQGASPLRMLAILAAAISWSIGSLYGGRAPLPRSPLLTTAMQMLCGGVLLSLAGIISGELPQLDVALFSGSSLLALAYLIVFGSLVAFTAYSWLIRVAPPSLVSTYAYVNPVIAVFLGWIIGGEVLSADTLLGAAVTVMAVILITSRKAKKA